MRLTTDATEIKWIIRSIMNKYMPKLNNLEEKNIFLETYTLSKLNHEETESSNRLIMTKEIKLGLKNLPTMESSGPDCFTGEFHQIVKEKVTPIFKLV